MVECAHVTRPITPSRPSQIGPEAPVSESKMWSKKYILKYRYSIWKLSICTLVPPNITSSGGVWKLVWTILGYTMCSQRLGQCVYVYLFLKSTVFHHQIWWMYKCTHPKIEMHFALDRVFFFSSSLIYSIWRIINWLTFISTCTSNLEILLLKSDTD